MSCLTTTRRAFVSTSFRVHALFAALALFVCLSAAPGALALTYTVTTTADADAGSLRQAILNANGTADDDTIIFNIPAANCPFGVCTITLASEITITNNGALTVNGTGARNLIIDGGAGTNRIFFSNEAIFTLSGVTLTGGNGAGADNNGAGGAILSSRGTMTISGVHFNANVTTNNGAGIYIFTGTNHRIENSTFSGNTASSGGGIFVETANLTIVNTTFSGNSAGNGFGGGVLVSGSGTLTLRGDTFTANTARSGGGVYRDTGTLDVGNTVIAGNTATIGFPEIYFFSGAVTSQGFNIVGDSAGDSGNTSGAITYQPTDILDTPPRFAPLGNYGGQTPTRALLSGSPAINSGSAGIAGTLTTDQRGAARVGSTDIGAFELNASFVAALPNANVSQPYDQTIIPNKGAFTYSITSGTLPAGLTFNGSAFASPVEEKPATDVDSPQVNAVKISGTPIAGAASQTFTITGTDGTNSESTVYRINIAAPTAAVSISGTVITPRVFGLVNAFVTLTDSNGISRTVIAGRTGSFIFRDVAAGGTYIISVRSKRYTYAAQIVTVNEDLSGLTFTPQ